MVFKNLTEAKFKNRLYLDALDQADGDTDKADEIYKKMLKSRNPNPKTPESDMKKNIVPKMMKASGGRINFRGGGICKKGMNKKARGANS
jgi:hypothetical protein